MPSRSPNAAERFEPPSPEETARERQNLAMRWTIALSVTLHVLVFSLGVSYPPTMVGSDALITLHLTLELDQTEGRDPENEPAPATDRAIELGPTHTPPFAAIADGRPSEIEPDLEASASEPAPAALGEISPDADLVQAATFDASDASETPSTDIITTTGESERFEPAKTTEALEPPTLVALTPEQQEHIQQKTLKWVQTLGEAEADADPQLSWQQDGRAYTAVLKRRPAANSTDLESAIVELATVEQGKELRTRMQLRRLAFSQFSQLVDHWDPTVQFHDDEIVGRFHSNSEIKVGYGRVIAPVFHGKVTTAAGGFGIANWYRSRPRTEIFRAGFESRAGRVSLPRMHLHRQSDSLLGSTHVHEFNRDTRITFYSDGTYGWQPLRSDGREERAALGAGPTLLIGDRGAELHVRGTVRGKVLVYSPERIWIDGSLVYANNPRDNPGAQDYLGLASDKYVDIPHPDVTGPGDLEIHAAIYARRRFTVTYEFMPGSGTLIVFGSLTAGTMSPTEPRYATRVEFDPRFDHTRPPGFPMTNRYELEQWDGQWQDGDPIAN
jgi:hypothetical protein